MRWRRSGWSPFALVEVVVLLATVIAVAYAFDRGANPQWEGRAYVGSVSLRSSAPPLDAIQSGLRTCIRQTAVAADRGRPAPTVRYFHLPDSWIIKVVRENASDAQRAAVAVAQRITRPGRVCPVLGTEGVYETPVLPREAETVRSGRLPAIVALAGALVLLLAVARGSRRPRLWWLVLAAAAGTAVMGVLATNTGIGVVAVAWLATALLRADAAFAAPFALLAAGGSALGDRGFGVGSGSGRVMDLAVALALGGVAIHHRGDWRRLFTRSAAPVFLLAIVYGLQSLHGLGHGQVHEILYDLRPPLYGAVLVGAGLLLQRRAAEAAARVAVTGALVAVAVVAANALNGWPAALPGSRLVSGVVPLLVAPALLLLLTAVTGRIRLVVACALAAGAVAAAAALATARASGAALVIVTVVVVLLMNTWKGVLLRLVPAVVAVALILLAFPGAPERRAAPAPAAAAAEAAPALVAAAMDPPVLGVSSPPTPAFGADASWRRLLWAEAARDARRTPLLGHGLGHALVFRTPEGDRLRILDAHDVFLTSWVKTGIFGPVALLAMFGVALGWTVRAVRRRPRRPVEISLLGGFAVWAAATLVQPAFESPSQSVIGWTLFAALAGGATRRDGPEPAP
jgi:O-antigen ligase